MYNADILVIIIFVMVKNVCRLPLNWEDRLGSLVSLFRLLLDAVTEGKFLFIYFDFPLSILLNHFLITIKILVLFFSERQDCRC